ncbi:hypothetical protein KUTeg_000037 [Tegillarca granosa]|uniref:P2X purinoreceptor 7 intracellular domain-containing protein n=1 Tax=Tegillarca granosa TaxID=220873 RepID=A0ABQ9FZT5_TEGGR|nr:hypothetical protein KUTeg_000037 [Tegillarca granosa]
MEKITSKLEDFPSIGCITEHPGFRNVCLDQYVLETAYYVYRQSHHVEIEDPNKRNRYVAYKQLVRWCWGWLGKNIRIPLPSCVVRTIRDTFPCENDNYVGFNPDSFSIQISRQAVLGVIDKLDT